MLQIAICDDEVTNILKVKELAELFLGKNVLNARITQEQFVEEMKKIKYY